MITNGHRIAFRLKFEVSHCGNDETYTTWQEAVDRMNYVLTQTSCFGLSIETIEVFDMDAEELGQR